MPIYLLGIVILGIFLVSQNTSKGSNLMDRVFGLADIEPENQGGNYKKDYDLIFFHIAEKRKVPFALLKSHSIQESSINPRAFTDENPKGRIDRQGWASRGLMQVLWWPGSNRFKKYGYDDSVLDDGEALYNPEINVDIAAQIILENLKNCDGNLRDAINMYNTGAIEAKRQAPFNYVDRVLNYYYKILNQEGNIV